MQTSRRSFLKTALIAGGSLLFKGCIGGRQEPEATGESPSNSNDDFEPAYVRLERSGEFAPRIEEAFQHLQQCDLCPRECGVDRLSGEVGLCRAPEKVVVYSSQAHRGEELPLVGHGGSGTVFFSNCNLRCVFCQNWPVAHEGRGRQYEHEELADDMLKLQRNGCHNINLVTPTHVMPHILEATRIAMQKGLRLPLCYNTGGYERAQIVRLLDGIVDIYLPDLKFADSEAGEKYLGGVPDYPENAKEAILEMHRQVGELQTDSSGIAKRGLMIRHLVMPNDVADTQAAIEWIAVNLPNSTYVNIMAQYRVEHEAFEYPEIARSLESREFVEAIDYAKDVGLTNLDERSLSRYNVHKRRM